MPAPLAPAEFVLACLDHTADFIRALPESIYRENAGPVGANVGAHLRHSLEHVAEILNAIDSGEVYFERRQRDARIASDPTAGLAELQRLRANLAQAWKAGRLERPVTSRCSLSGDLDSSLCIPSSMARELAYVGLHFTHHMALMAAAARWHGANVAEGFGKAPATLFYEAGSRA